MPLFEREKSLSELEEEKEHEEARVSLLRQRLMRKELEQKMGSKGALSFFKSKDGVPVWKRVEAWLKTH